MKFLSLLIFSIIPVISFTQIVKIVDEISLKPIENVLIYCESETVMTDENGKADISSFKGEDEIIFKHTAYKDLILSFDDIIYKSFSIKLKESIFNINEVVVSANSWEQDKSEVPNRINIITNNSINFSNSQTSADILKLSGEVFVQKSQMGGGSPMIRGFSANRILLVVDGIRMNNAIYRSGNLQNVISLDANSVESSEIIFGPGSVIYGSDALGGVMDFHTLRPKFSDSEKLRFEGNSKVRFSSANNEKTGHLDLNFGLKKIAFISSVSYSDYDNLKMGTVGNADYKRVEYVNIENGFDIVLPNTDKNIQKFSAYNQFNFLQKVRYNPNDSWDITYSYYYSKTSDIPRYDRLIQYNSDKVLKYAEWFYGPQKWTMNSLTIRYSGSSVLFNKARFVSAYQEYSESRHDRKIWESDLRSRFEKVKIVNNNLDFEKELNKHSFLYYGTEAFYNKIFSSGEINNIYTDDFSLTSSRYPDNSHYMSFAAYISYKNNLSKKLTLNTGLRYNKILARAEMDTMFFSFPFDEIFLNTGAINGSLGIVYKPMSWQFNFNVSTGFRAPNIDDLAKVFDSEPGNVVVPNDNLVPEIAYNVDVGIVKRIKDFVQIDAAGFFTYLDNALVRSDFVFNGSDSIFYDGEMSNVQAIVNADNAYLYGFQISLNAELTRTISLKTNYNYTRGKDSFNKPLRHVAPAFGSTHLIYKTKKFKIDLSSEYNAEISFNRLADSERSKTYMYAVDENGNPFSPSWYTLNIGTCYQFNKVFRIQAGVENIFDIRYRPYSSGIVAPGRNFIISLNARI